MSTNDANPHATDHCVRVRGAAANNLRDVDGDVDAVRRANAEDPRREIYDGRPAVRPAAAAT